jgi:diacylglycerol kinase (ATP)
MSHPQKSRTGLNRVWHAFGYSMAGLATAVRNESAFRQEVALAAIMVPSAFWLGRTWVEVALLAGSVLAVLITELLNSAIEAVVDRISEDLHDLSKRAKDYGSAAVWISLVTCGSFWAAALYQRFSS